MQSRRDSCHYPCKQTVGLRHATAVFRAGFCCSAAQCYHFFQQQFYDPGRTRTCNLWFRRPTPCPLGHRTSWNTGSRPLQLQMPPSLELLKSGMCPWRTMGAPACGTGFPHEKRPPFWVKADLFVRSLQSKDLQSVSVFLVRARSFSHFLHGFLFWFILHFHVCFVFGCSKKCLAGVVFGDLCCSGLVCQNLSSDGGCHSFGKRHVFPAWEVFLTKSSRQVTSTALKVSLLK